MTLAELLADCYRRCGYTANPPDEIQELFRGHLNDTQQELAGDPALASLLRGATTFATVADRAEYGLPPTVSRILAIRETTNNRRLRLMTRDAYRTSAPDPSQQTGTPDVYVPLGPMAVAIQPAFAQELFVVSPSAPNTDTLQAEVVTTGGYGRTVVVTLTGTTAVSLGLFDIESVVDWYLSVEAPGIVQLLDASLAELARIGIGETRVRYQGLALLPTPSDARTYLVEHEREVTELVTPEDSPIWLPPAFHRLLAAGGRRRHWEDKREADRYTAATADYASSLAKLKAFVNNPPDQTLIPSAWAHRRPSDLGGQYPAGTIWD